MLPNLVAETRYGFILLATFNFHDLLGLQPCLQILN
jgi:hypothetical protein